MSSKYEKNKNESKTKKKHPGGPLQHKELSAESWNQAVGSSLEVIPKTQLPTKRTVLRRYPYLPLNNKISPLDVLAPFVMS